MDDRKLEEMYRLTQENNRMLRHMRRNALLGGIIKVILYAALIVVPLWFYYVYMAPVIENMLETMQELQGTGAQAQAQFSSLQELWEKFQAQMPFGQN